jgi:hypothetical protein
MLPAGTALYLQGLAFGGGQMRTTNVLSLGR